MGYLTTFTVYNDNCDEIPKQPKGFAKEIYLACCNPNINYGSNVFYGIVIPQKTRHADDWTVYIHAGNTVCEMNRHSETTMKLMKNSPEFFEKKLNYMEQNLNELKKQFKAIKNETK